jgi:hypothetical protein
MSTLNCKGGLQINHFKAAIVKNIQITIFLNKKHLIKIALKEH